MAKAQSNPGSKERAISEEIEMQLRLLLQLIDATETVIAGVELAFVRDPDVDSKLLVTCVVSNIADELGQIGNTVKMLLITLGGEPYVLPSKYGPETTLDKATRKGRPKS